MYLGSNNDFYEYLIDDCVKFRDQTPKPNKLEINKKMREISHYLNKGRIVHSQYVGLVKIIDIKFGGDLWQ